jgi:hypothetical protein
MEIRRQYRPFFAGSSNTGAGRLLAVVAGDLPIAELGISLSSTGGVSFTP